MSRVLEWLNLILVLTSLSEQNCRGRRNGRRSLSESANIRSQGMSISCLQLSCFWFLSVKLVLQNIDSKFCYRQHECVDERHGENGTPVDDFAYFCTMKISSGKTSIILDLVFCLVFMPALMILGTAQFRTESPLFFLFLVAAFYYIAYFVLRHPSVVALFMQRKYRDSGKSPWQGLTDIHDTRYMKI